MSENLTELEKKLEKIAYYSFGSIQNTFLRAKGKGECFGSLKYAVLSVKGNAEFSLYKRLEFSTSLCTENAAMS